jgi:hypothetical protein
LGLQTSICELRAPYCSPARKQGDYYKIFTARAAINATVINDIDACTIIISFAQRDSTGTSVGENAVLVLNARNK